MALKNIEATLSEKIKTHILAAWQEGHGGSADQVHLLQGEDGLALLMPKALYQAEIDLFRNTTGGTRVVNQYLRTLLDTISSEHVPLIEEFTQQTVEEIVPLIDLRAGWIIAFYRFKKS